MKKLILFLVIFSGMFYLFGKEEAERVSAMAAISKAPGFAPAHFVSIEDSSSKKHASFRAKFRYEVDGKSYLVTTTQTDSNGIATYLADKNAQIAYSTQDPSIGTMKRYYDLRDPRETMSSAMLIVGVLALGLTLPIWLGIGWRLGWFRKKKPETQI
jgi:hypothetical protein